MFVIVCVMLTVICRSALSSYDLFCDIPCFEATQRCTERSTDEIFKKAEHSQHALIAVIHGVCTTLYAWESGDGTHLSALRLIFVFDLHPFLLIPPLSHHLAPQDQSALTLVLDEQLVLL
jgi:hypothetical protein